MPTLNEDLDSVLHSLLGLYGAGQPEQAGMAAKVREMAEAAADGFRGAGSTGYADAHAMRTSVVASHADKDGVVEKAVGTTGGETLNGRNHISNQIADLQTRLRAIATIGDSRFSGPAMLDAAHATITSATRQVDTDVAAAQRQAAAISPPAAPQRKARHVAASPTRRRRRRRSRSQAQSVSHATGATRSRSKSRSRPYTSDGTAGGNAVRAASAWLGAPYIWGGGGAGGPSGGGFDCSGLTQYAVAQATDGQVVLPRTTYEQIYSGDRVPVQDVRPGDLVFPASSFSARGPEHVQLAAGGGMVIEAPYSGSTVRWTKMPSDAVVIRVM
ncbi:cell wall-associated NlpC family hydrolase [Nocardia transvalensis]|uniref:Cell wall-associated NlpC family hydrolase n=1 Tax=Nocardia transvalensis TaxID=37333 RepID=A0A7W9PM85_9NOCA|nr:NlpC/P60 family protein [Nocardia transvalensis]MBB5918755.1 cell wall-associated NlpC family hydrolase [Nocardia transvalensis]